MIVVVHNMRCVRVTAVAGQNQLLALVMRTAEPAPMLENHTAWMKTFIRIILISTVTCLVQVPRTVHIPMKQGLFRIVQLVALVPHASSLQIDDISQYPEALIESSL